MEVDENAKTVKYKLNAPDGFRERMSKELEKAPSYSLRVVPGETGPTIETADVPVKRSIELINDEAVTTLTQLSCPSLHQKLKKTPADMSENSRYERLSLLGEGGAGQVFEMMDHNIKRRVAVKLLKNSDSQGEIDAFIREGELSAELEHPNIVPIYNMDVDDQGHVFLSMKKVVGDSLLAMVMDGSIGLEDIIPIILKVCDALSYAHSLGKIHQDVKPENIMIGEFGEVFLIDWGAGSETGEELQLSPVYMSPQQAKGYHPTVEDDVYCLGATLFHVLTKRFPTNANTIDELWERKVAGEIDLPTDKEQATIPSALLAIALKAMEPEKDDRYLTVAEFAADIKAFQGGYATSAENAGLMTLLALLLKRRWKEILMVTAVLLIIISSGIRYYHDIQIERVDRLEAELQAANLKFEKHELKLKKEKLEQEKKEQWAPLMSADFTQPGKIDSAFEGTDGFVGEPGGILLGFRSPYQRISMLRGIPFEPKIEVTFSCSGTPHIDLGVFNEFGVRTHELSVTHNVSLAVVRDKGRPSHNASLTAASSSSSSIASIIRADVPNTLVVWLRNGTWHATLNGAKMVTYYDPGVELEGMYAFRVKRTLHLNELRIQSIRVWGRQAPSVVSILEPGKLLYRQGDFPGAREWFLRQSRSAVKESVRQEAAYLAAICNVGGDVEDRIRELTTIADQVDHPNRGAALHIMTVLSSPTEDLPRTLDYLERVSQLVPQFNTYSTIWPDLRRQLLQSPVEKRMEISERLSRLPITDLSLYGIGIKELSPINSSVRQMQIHGNPIEDISLLKGLPLDSVHMNRTEIVDLSPLKGMKLKELSINDMAITDLSPLDGMELDTLTAKRSLEPIDLATLGNTTILKPIFDRSRLKNIAHLKRTNAVHLRLRRCNLTDLNFAQSMRLFVLEAPGNKINDISGLAGQSLSNLVIDSNQLRDLSPFKTIQVTNWLHLGNNPIEDISPLAGQPLKILNISNTNVRDLSALREMKNLQKLIFEGGRVSVPPDLSTLDGISLSILYLAKQRLTSIAPLKNCNITDSLILSGNPISDLSPLSSQPTRGLGLADTQVTDLSPLESLERLEVLIISSSSPKTASLSDISPVCTDHLKILEAENCTIRDISPLKVCSDLEILDLSGNPVTDLAPLKGLPLAELRLSRMKIIDFSVLRSLKDLRIFVSDGLSADKPGQLRDLSDFIGFSLSELSLSNNQISDIRPLRMTTVTTRLDLSGNPITDISPLEKSVVNDLNISHTKVTNLSALRTMPNLQKLAILGLTLDSESDQLLKKMPWLQVIRE